MGVIDELINEHNKYQIAQRTKKISSDESNSAKLLCKIIKPTILKLTESKHSKDMYKLGPDSFLEEFDWPENNKD